MSNHYFNVPRNLTIPIIVILMAGCSNYQFKNSMLPNGEYNIDKLVKDLQLQSSAGRLVHTGWIPLIYRKDIVFQRIGMPAIGENSTGVANVSTRSAFNWSRYPDGFQLIELRRFGPLSIYAKVFIMHYDSESKMYEASEKNIILWRFWDAGRFLVRTQKGIRDAKRVDLIFGILPGYIEVSYLGNSDTELSQRESMVMKLF